VLYSLESEGFRMHSKLLFRAVAMAAALLSTAGAARAADVIVLPVVGTNVSPGEADAIGVLMTNAFASEARVDVAGPADTARAIQEAGSVQAALAKLGAREYLETTAIQLKSRIALRAVLRDATGEMVHAADMTAASLDDVQPVTLRMARALVQRRGVDDTRTLRTVTRREALAPNRTYTEKVMGLKTAVTWPYSSENDFAPSMSLQFDGRLERTWGFLEFGVGMALPTSNSRRDGLGALFAEFGGSAYFMEAATSAYLGAGVMPRIYWTEDDGGVSASVYGQLGVMFLRDSSSRVYVEFRAAQSVIPFEDEDCDFYGCVTGDEYYPTELGLQVGIGW
jgi:hypothetical protein